jgi:hypothetical protein
MRSAAFYLFCSAVITLLLLSILNIANYSQKQKVLGITTNPPLEYWQNLVRKNPTYFEGWLELYSLTGDESYLNEAKRIKPNYF